MNFLSIKFFVFLLFIGCTSVNTALSHVIPEDELRNQVYLSDREALAQVFQGIRKIKKEKRKLTSAQAKNFKQLSGQTIRERKKFFYAGETNNGKTYATIDKANANSHPPTEAKFVLLIDSEGRVKDIHIMEYKGPQRAELISREFLDQYKGKIADSDFSQITSNQGPTPSVLAMSQSVRQTLISFKILYLAP